MLRSTIHCLIAGSAIWIVTALPAVAFESGRAAFSVTVNNDLVVPYRVFALYVLPGERLELQSSATRATADDGQIAAQATGVWRWTAPMLPGVVRLTLTRGNDEIRLNAVVMHSASQVSGGQLSGYQIGDYPGLLNGDAVYTAPDGFIELTSDLLELQLSPHFTMGQFPSKQSTALPKYLVLREQLLMKLELLLEHFNEVGVETDSFAVMSGYRTPMYNRVIGNGQHSRHVYGGAADIYIDVAPRDDIMDDLNQDGIFDYRDAQWLYQLADAFFARPENAYLNGGLGVYRSTAAHGPFLHIDARGRRARWGLLP